MQNYNKFKNILIGILIINIVLVATHEGEFWPFSIFPMFSQAGNPWSRGLVQELDTSSPEEWDIKSLEEVQPNVIALDKYGIDQIDYANFISKTEDWNEKRLQALIDMLQTSQNIADEKYWLITKVEGFLVEGDSVAVQAIPLFRVSADSLVKNPNIFN